jgi:hypothetical protein
MTTPQIDLVASAARSEQIYGMKTTSPLPAEWQRDKIAERLRLIRKVMRWEQADAAEAVGVSGNQWSNYERALSGFPYYAAQRLEMRTGFMLQWVYNGHDAILPEHLRREITKARAVVD